MSAAEFVRERILALARDPASADRTAGPASIAALIERIFRYIWFLATERRDAMVREGRTEELDKLVAEARGLQESLRRGPRTEPGQGPELPHREAGVANTARDDAVFAADHG